MFLYKNKRNRQWRIFAIINKSILFISHKNRGRRSRRHGYQIPKPTSSNQKLTFNQHDAIPCILHDAITVTAELHGCWYSSLVSNNNKNNRTGGRDAAGVEYNINMAVRNGITVRTKLN